MAPETDQMRAQNRGGSHSFQTQWKDSARVCGLASSAASGNSAFLSGAGFAPGRCPATWKTWLVVHVLYVGVTGAESGDRDPAPQAGAPGTAPYNADSSGPASAGSKRRKPGAALRPQAHDFTSLSSGSLLREPGAASTRTRSAGCGD